MLALLFKYFTQKNVPTKDTTNTRAKNIEANPRDIRPIAISWIRAASVVYATRNPEVPDTTSGRKSKLSRAKLIICPDPIPRSPCRSPAPVAPPRRSAKFLYLAKLVVQIYLMDLQYSWRWTVNLYTATTTIAMQTRVRTVATAYFPEQILNLVMLPPWQTVRTRRNPNRAVVIMIYLKWYPAWCLSNFFLSSDFQSSIMVSRMMSYTVSSDSFLITLTLWMYFRMKTYEKYVQMMIIMMSWVRSLSSLFRTTPMEVPNSNPGTTMQTTLKSTSDVFRYGCRLNISRTKLAKAPPKFTLAMRGVASAALQLRRSMKMTTLKIPPESPPTFVTQMRKGRMMQMMVGKARRGSTGRCSQMAEAQQYWKGQSASAMHESCSIWSIVKVLITDQLMS